MQTTHFYVPFPVLSLNFLLATVNTHEKVVVLISSHSLLYISQSWEKTSTFFSKSRGGSEENINYTPVIF